MEEQPSAAYYECRDNQFQPSCRTSDYCEHFIRCTKGVETNIFGANIVWDTTFTIKGGLIGSQKKPQIPVDDTPSCDISFDHIHCHSCARCHLPWCSGLRTCSSAQRSVSGDLANSLAMYVLFNHVCASADRW